ncbi:MAG: hypothetical protein KGL44_10110 [Sphingomonadales bacterium]|nr:hypothetical protein [Sphingomonadales bacterium]
MILPMIDVSALPDLHTLTGVFGSLLHPAQAHSSDDTLLILMTYVYDVLPPEPNGLI